ncbi:MAG TPA: hypothetical protein VNU97_05800 [Rhizomicrobium sp.]|nr:hypothetical protein [Rhizomicrobium sp.]
MLRAAAEAHFAAVPNAHHERMIRKLLDTAQNYSQRRNEIAHGFVNGWRPEGTPVSEHGYVLMPFMHAPRKARFDASAVAPHSSPKRPLLRPTYLYSSAEIMVLCHRFQILTQEAVHLPTTIFYERRRAEKLGLLRK